MAGTVLGTLQLNQQTYRKLISGQHTGLFVVILRLVLRIAAVLYAIVVRLRNISYSHCWLKAYRISRTGVPVCSGRSVVKNETRRCSASRSWVPVISMGNITAGGTGKTPLVIWLCNLLKPGNISCAILTRGYKTKGNEFSDEPAVITSACPEAKIIVNPNRLAGACEAVTKFGAQVLIMDDGFQHRRLHRDLDIVAIDATLPFGYGKMLPAGLLRESLAALKRADAAVITRCDQVDPAKLDKLRNRLCSINPNMAVAQAIHSPVCAKSAHHKKIGLDQLKGKKIFAFCGIGNPGAFLNTVKGLGANLVGSRIYNDHHHYTDRDIAEINDQARSLHAELILSTEKDHAKTTKLIPSEKNALFAFLVVRLEFISQEDEITQLIETVLGSKICEK